MICHTGNRRCSRAHCIVGYSMTWALSVVLHIMRIIKIQHTNTPLCDLLHVFRCLWDDVIIWWCHWVWATNNITVLYQKLYQLLVGIRSLSHTHTHFPGIVPFSPDTFSRAALTHPLIIILCVSVCPARAHMGLWAPGHAGKEQMILKWSGGAKVSRVCVCVCVFLSQGTTNTTHTPETESTCVLQTHFSSAGREIQPVF